MKSYYAPETYSKNDMFTVFLAGSIEGDAAENWQKMVIDSLLNEKLNVLNPRRPSWDNSWKQEIENPEFYKQVNWELEGLENADLIIMYFDRDTKSPISLLELGLFARSKKIIVCCPKGFWRKGNVDIVCERYGISQVENISDLVDYVKKKLK